MQTGGRVSDRLDAESLQSLLSGSAMAIVLDDFVPAEESVVLSRRIQSYIAADPVLSQEAFTFIGTTIGEAHGDKEAEERYFSQSAQTAKLYGETLFPNGSPIARMVARLLMLWPMGVKVAHRGDAPFLPEVVRRMRGGGSAIPHMDLVDTHLLAGLHLRGRIAANVYLETSQNGGDLELWTYENADFDPHVRREDQGLTRAVLGEPAVRIKPRRGQAILFCSWRAHAVTGVEGSEQRITNSTFIGIPRFNGPLTLFA